MRQVIDASVALAWFFPDEGPAPFTDLLRHADAEPLLVPGLWLYEVTNAITIAVRRKRITSRFAEEALDLLAAVPTQVVHLGWFEMRGAERLATDHNLTAYDASYLFLAKQFDARLNTLDAAMLKAAKRLKLV